MRVDVNGTTLFYEKLGSGPPLLLVHGNGGTHRVFRRMAKVLAPHFTLYLPDTRGHGDSGKTDVFHYEDFAADLVAFCAALKIEKPVFVGHSDGGITGLLLASRYPDLLKEAFICGANLTPRGFYAPVRGAIRLWSLFNKNDRIRLMLREPRLTEEDLHKITIPVHVTAGMFDIVRKKETLAIVNAIPDADLKIFPLREHNAYVMLETALGEYVLEKTGANAEGAAKTAKTGPSPAPKTGNND